MILIFDTETTGLINWKAPLTDNTQPRLVQLGLIICEDDGKIKKEKSLVVKPEGYIIPPNMVHGITHEFALEKGVTMTEALLAIRNAMTLCDLHIAHNYVFDRAILLGEFRRAKLDESNFSKDSFCTMLNTTNICCIPKKNGKKGNKWPKLEEAYEYFFGEKMEGAHDALADCRAAHRIYFEGLLPLNYHSYNGQKEQTLQKVGTEPGS